MVFGMPYHARTVFCEASVELVMPSLSALLPVSRYHLACDKGPLLDPMLLNKASQHIILLGGPRPPIIVSINVVFATPANKKWAHAVSPCGEDKTSAGLTC